MHDATADTTDDADVPVVWWPDPSPLEPWWKAVMFEGLEAGRAGYTRTAPSA